MKFFLKKTANTRMVFFIGADAILIAISIWLAFLIRFEGNIPSVYQTFVIRMAVLTIIFTIPIFYFQKLYHFSWAYVSISDLINLFKATIASFIFLSITIYLSKYFPSFSNFPRSTILISYFLIFIFCGGLRFSKRIYLDIFGAGKGLIKKDRVIIVGAGDAGEQILRSIISSKNTSYLPVGFVDDNPIKKGVNIHGLKVLGKIVDIPEITKKYNAEGVIIAIPSAGKKVIKNAVEIARKAKIKKIKIVPPMAEIIDGVFSVGILKDIDTGDLLGREPVNLNTTQIENFIKGKTVLITGAAGSIGSELSRQVSKFSPSLLLLLDQDETGIFNIFGELKNKVPDLKMKSLIADVRDEKKISKIFLEFNPKIVFHAAAYKHVPLMEENPDEAVKNNIFGTEVVVKNALQFKAEKLIFISTDKAVNPTSIMGATKRVGEMICQVFNQKNSTKFISVRFGNVLDSRGSVIPTFREQIKRRGPLTVTHPDMRRYFMLTSEACLLVMQAGAMGKGGEVFVLDMGKPIKIIDLAKEMIRLSGFEPDKDIPIVFTGIRPGEKLFEEILTAEEGTIATQNQKIFIAKLSDISSSDLEKRLKELESIITDNKKEEIIKFLQKLIPFYKLK